MLVASKLPSELTPEELVTRSNLVQARRLEDTARLVNAPDMKSFESGCNFAIGASCKEDSDWDFHQVKALIERAQAKQPSVLNYSDLQVEKALREYGSSENAQGFTQSEYNCGEDDGDTSAIQFDWDGHDDSRQNACKSVHAQIAPLLKEYQDALENSSPGTREREAEDIRSRTNALNARRKLAFGEGTPIGKTVSAKLQRRHPGKSHMKQI
jgi:hypothetical protein